MKVSILISTLDAGEMRRSIDDILATAGGSADFEIVACAPFAFEAPRTRFVADTAARGASWAYKLASDAARGDVLVHVTDGKRLRAGWLEAAIGLLATRDGGGPPFVACLPMHDPAYGDGFVGTVVGRLYPWYFATHRRTVDLLGPYFDLDLKGAFLDTDFGMRVWRSGGRCEIVPGGAWYGVAEGTARVRPHGISWVDDFRKFADRWFAATGLAPGYGQRQLDGTLQVAPWHICFDVPLLFFAHFVRDGTILQTGSDWPRVGAFLRVAARMMNREGLAIPASILENPAHLPDWVLAVAAARERAEAQTGTTPNGSQ